MSKTQQKPAPIEEVAGPHRMLRATISGYYGGYDGKMVHFRKVQGVLPYVADKGIARMHVKDRYSIRFLENSIDPRTGELFPAVKQVFQCELVKLEETTGTLSFVGKNIKDLEDDEIQDLATQKDLRFIPLPNSGMGWIDMLKRAYVAYSEKINRRKIKDWQSDEFDFEGLPDITLNADGRIENEEKFTNEEIIALEQKGRVVSEGKDDPTKRFTLEQLKTIADGKQITYDNDVSFEDLYNALFKG